MKWYDSIKVKLLGFFIGISILFLITIVITFFLIRENNLQDNASKEATLATSQILGHIKSTQTKAEELVLTLASVAKKEFENGSKDKGIIESILSTNNKDSIDIVSGGVWFEPNVVNKNINNYMLFYSRDTQGEFKKIENYIPNYRDMEFYQLSTKTKDGEVVWTGVYTDPVIQVYMITVSSPIYKNNIFIGTVSLDIEIGDSNPKFWNVQESKHSYMMMTDKNGNFIAKSKGLNNFIHTTNLYKIENSNIKKLVNKLSTTLTHKSKHTHNNTDILKKIYLIESDPIIDKKSIVAVYHFPSTHWNIIIGIPEDIVMAQSNQIFNKVLSLIILVTLIATIIGYFILQKLFVNPIQSINEQLQISTENKNLHYKLLESDDKGEIGALVDNFNNRTIALADAQDREEREIIKSMKSEKMLLQQSKMAAMGEMMDAVAHQWKQPLNALSMYTEIIKSDFTDGSVDKDYIDQFRDDIQVQIDHMVNTLDEFRTFFRPNKEHGTFSLLSIIHSVLFLTKDDLLKNRITVDIEQKDHIDIDGSSNEFKHLLLNIISNAKDAFNGNSIEKRTIHIRLINDSESKRMEIEDNAGGIPEKIINDIFKANITSKEESKGTGIGLYMSTQIATKHHAVLSVKNIHNGACFTLTFNS